MYIWVAINVDNQLAKQKEIVKKIEKEICFSQSNVESLPLHISLKISTEVPRKYENSIKNDIISLLDSTAPFIIDIDRIEQNDTIIWIKMKENIYLKALHEKLCSIFNDKYGIKLHEFDSCFMYHVTLFLDSSEEKINEAFLKVKPMALPSKLIANKFIIGSSPDGTIGSYSVDFMIRK